jgi:hypothetical protein
MGKSQTQPATVGKAYQLLPVIGPSAGVDLRTTPTLLPPEKAHTLVNFSLTEPGALVVRPGWRAFSSQLGTGRIQGGARVYLNTAIPAAASTAFSVIGWNGGLYQLTDSGGWVSTTPVLTGLSAKEYSFPSDRDLVAVMDGSTTPWKSTNGATWTKLGITAPTVASTLSSKANGSLSASEFEINYAYKDRDLAVESNGGSTPSTVTLSSTGAIEVQCANSTDPQVDAIILYARNKTNGETVRRKVSSFAMQSTAAGSHSTTTITSSVWTTNDEEPTDHTPAPVLSFGVVWKNRWWARSATVTNRLHFTQIFQPQSWPALFYIDIPFERGDAIQALIPLGDTLIVCGTTKKFLILGQTSLDFDVRPTIASINGAFGFRSVAAIENTVITAGPAGVSSFDGATDKLLNFDLEPGWRDLVANGSPTDLAKISLVYHQQLKELRISVPRRYPTGTWGEWILDLNRTRTTQQPAWTATDRTVGGYVLWDGPETQAGNQQRLLTWHSSNAQIFEESVGTSANSSNLTAEYEGPGLTLGRASRAVGGSAARIRTARRVALGGARDRWGLRRHTERLDWRGARRLRDGHVWERGVCRGRPPASLRDVAAPRGWSDVRVEDDLQRAGHVSPL